MTAGLVLACDLVTKQLAVHLLADRPPVRLLDGVLTLRLVWNPGAAFGIGGGMTALFSLIALVVAAVIVRMARDVRSFAWALTLGLLLGGALGNLVDRMVRPPAPLRGHVVDWIELPRWPVFNLADVAIVCGGALVVILAARGVRVDGSRTRQP